MIEKNQSDNTENEDARSLQVKLGLTEDRTFSLVNCMRLTTSILPLSLPNTNAALTMPSKTRTCSASAMHNRGRHGHASYSSALDMGN